jgi:flagellar basal-body rod protein FlgG
MTGSLFHVLNISRIDMLAKTDDLDIVSNNVANINTAGYRSNRGNFQEMLEKLNYEGINLASSQLIVKQGAIHQTKNQLDIAIQGDGFFGVTLASGKIGYTRDGQFLLDSTGKIVNGNGNPLVWSGTIPPETTEIQIQPDGIVRALVGDLWTEAGTIQLTRFANASGLQISGNNLLVETPASGAPQNGAPGTPNFGSLLSQSVEDSNVNYADEVTHLMALQRGFQMSSRTFQTTDTMITQAIHMRKA